MQSERQAERLGDRRRGDVIMGGTDAAGREHIVAFCAQLVNRGDDRGLHIGDEATLNEAHAPTAVRPLAI